MAKERYDAFPSRMSLQLFKGKKKAASLGYNLLKKKADALKARQRELLEEIWACKLELNGAIKDSYFSQTKATYAAGIGVFHHFFVVFVFCFLCLCFVNSLIQSVTPRNFPLNLKSP